MYQIIDRNALLKTAGLLLTHFSKVSQAVQADLFGFDKTHMADIPQQYDVAVIRKAGLRQGIFKLKKTRWL